MVDFLLRVQAETKTAVYEMHENRAHSADPIVLHGLGARLPQKLD
jgi:hypothetical protein